MPVKGPNIASLGAQAGAAAGFEKAATNFNDTMELRRKQRIERMMHVENLSLGVERIMQQRRTDEINRQLTVMQVAALDARDIRGHEQRWRLKQFEFTHDIQKEKISHDRALEVMGLEQGYESDQADLQRSADQLRQETASYSGNVNAHTNRRIQEAEQSESLKGHIRQWASTGFRDEDGHFDADWPYKEAERRGVSVDVVFDEKRDEFITALRGDKSFENLDLQDVVTDNMFRIWSVAEGTGRQDQMDAAAKALDIKLSGERLFQISDMANALTARVTDPSGSSAGFEVNFETGALDVPADHPQAAVWNSLIDQVLNENLSGASARALLQTKAGELGLTNERGLGAAAQELDLLFSMKHGRNPGFSNMHPSVLKQAKKQIAPKFAGVTPDVNQERLKVLSEVADTSASDQTNASGLARRAERVLRTRDHVAVFDLRTSIEEEIARVESDGREPSDALIEIQETVDNSIANRITALAMDSGEPAAEAYVSRVDSRDTEIEELRASGQEVPAELLSGQARDTHLGEKQLKKEPRPSPPTFMPVPIDESRGGGYVRIPISKLREDAAQFIDTPPTSEDSQARHELREEIRGWRDQIEPGRRQATPLEQQARDILKDLHGSIEIRNPGGR